MLGKNGMLGSCFLKFLSGDEDFEVYAFGRSELDICNFAELDKTFSALNPDFVINCAAYTAVDDCETNREEAFKVNGTAPGEIAKACKKANAILLHFSTDYVFDGQKAEGYREDDSTGPINVYGESKLEGERQIAANTDNFYIARISWLFGENGKNFVDTMMNLTKTRDTLDVVSDQIGSPTYARDICEASIRYFLRPNLTDVVVHHERSMLNGEAEKCQIPDFGIYHLTNSGHTSWNGFAKKIFEVTGMDIKVNEVGSDKFPRPAKRPSYSILLNTKLPKDLRSWEEAVTAYLELNYL